MKEEKHSALFSLLHALSCPHSLPLHCLTAPACTALHLHLTACTPLHCTHCTHSHCTLHTALPLHLTLPHLFCLCTPLHCLHHLFSLRLPRGLFCASLFLVARDHRSTCASSHFISLFAHHCTDFCAFWFISRTRFRALPLHLISGCRNIANTAAFIARYKTRFRFFFACLPAATRACWFSFACLRTQHGMRCNSGLLAPRLRGVLAALSSRHTRCTPLRAASAHALRHTRGLRIMPPPAAFFWLPYFSPLRTHLLPVARTVHCYLPFCRTPPHAAHWFARFLVAITTLRAVLCLARMVLHCFAHAVLLPPRFGSLVLRAAGFWLRFTAWFTAAVWFLSFSAFVTYITPPFFGCVGYRVFTPSYRSAVLPYRARCLRIYTRTARIRLPASHRHTGCVFNNIHILRVRAIARLLDTTFLGFQKSLTFSF